MSSVLQLDILRTIFRQLDDRSLCRSVLLLFCSLNKERCEQVCKLWQKEIQVYVQYS